MKTSVLAIMMLFWGCATTPVVTAPEQTKAAAGQQTESKVTASIRKLLDGGSAVAVMIDCNASCFGIPNGHMPEEYGCTADKDIAADVEKYLLLETFGGHPNFTLVDRSKMDASIKEIRLGMNGTTANSLEPGQFSGATHLLLIDSRDVLVRSKSKIEDHYIAVKKLLDLKKNVLVAMDKINDKHDVVYQPMLAPQSERSGERTRLAEPETEPQAEQSRADEEQTEEPLDLPNEPQVKSNEVITIYGEPEPKKPQTKMLEYTNKRPPSWRSRPYTNTQQDARRKSSFVSAYDGYSINRNEPPAFRHTYNRSSVLSHIIRQRYNNAR